MQFPPLPRLHWFAMTIVALAALAAIARAQDGAGLEDALDRYVNETLATDDPIVLTAEGRSLEPAEAARLETRLLSRPNDLQARYRLLGYYQTRPALEPTERRARAAHVLWFVSNRPANELATSLYTMLDPEDDADAVEQVRAAWLRQVERHATDPAVLRNAADFMLIHDRDAARELVAKGRALEPAAPDWPQRLGVIELLTATLSRDATDRREHATAAVAAYEDALRLSPRPADKFPLLGEAARAALMAGADDKARVFAESVVALAPGTDDRRSADDDVHDAHTVLGLLALRGDDLAGASQHLEASVKALEDTGRPAVAPPSDELARALLARGERDAVVQYLRRCAALWPAGRARLLQQATTIESGATPPAWPADDAAD